jgi:ankyrin repeat protein
MSTSSTHKNISIITHKEKNSVLRKETVNMGSVPTKVKENNNICALFRAIKEEKFERAKTLIYAGTAIDCINYDGSTPLIETCRNSRRYNDDREREKFVMFLIENGCDVSKSDIYGWNALLYALEQGYDSIATLLDKMERKTSYYEKRGK